MKQLILVVALFGVVACDAQKSATAPTSAVIASTNIKNPNETNPPPPPSTTPDMQAKYDECMRNKIEANCPYGCYQVLIDAFDSQCREWAGMAPANAKLPPDMKQPADWACNAGSCDDYQQP